MYVTLLPLSFRIIIIQYNIIAQLINQLILLLYIIVYRHVRLHKANSYEKMSKYKYEMAIYRCTRLKLDNITLKQNTSEGGSARPTTPPHRHPLVESADYYCVAAVVCVDRRNVSSFIHVIAYLGGWSSHFFFTFFSADDRPRARVRFITVKIILLQS